MAFRSHLTSINSWSVQPAGIRWARIPKMHLLPDRNPERSNSSIGGSRGGASKRLDPILHLRCTHGVVCHSYTFQRGGGSRQRGPDLKTSKSAENVWWPLLKKALITLSMLAMVRLLYFIPIRGVDFNNLPPELILSSPEQRMLQELFMAGGSVPLNLATLGITPIVFSSMMVSFLAHWPMLQTAPIVGSMATDLQQRQKSGALTPEEIDRKTMRGAIMMGSVMAFWQARTLQKFSILPNFVLNTVLNWLAALAITKYACSIIQDEGLGEGVGCLILALTLSGSAQRAVNISSLVTTGTIALWKVSLLSGLYICMIAMTVWATAAEIRIPTVNYNTGVTKREGAARLLAADDLLTSNPIKQAYLPLPLAQGGVTAIFLCSAVFCTFDSWLISCSFPAWASFVQEWPFRICSFGMGVFLASLVPLGVSSASMISEFLVSTNTGLQGVLPGEPTIVNLKSRLFEARFWGGISMFIIASLGLWLDWQSQAWLGTPLGALNLVLLVAVITAAARQVESILEGPKLKQIMVREQKVMNMVQGPDRKT